MVHVLNGESDHLSLLHHQGGALQYALTLSDRAVPAADASEPRSAGTSELLRTVGGAFSAKRQGAAQRLAAKQAALALQAPSQIHLGLGDDVVSTQAVGRVEGVMRSKDRMDLMRDSVVHDRRGFPLQ